jgi:hypothetical protein
VTGQQHVLLLSCGRRGYAVNLDPLGGVDATTEINKLVVVNFVQQSCCIGKKAKNKKALKSTIIPVSTIERFCAPHVFGY